MLQSSPFRRAFDSVFEPVEAPDEERWGASNIVQQFREAGATSPHRAQRYHARSSYDRAHFAGLLDLDVIRASAPGRYYLDEHMLQERIEMLSMTRSLGQVGTVVMRAFQRIFGR